MWCFIEVSTLGGRIEGGGGGGKGRTREDSSTVEFRRSPGRSRYNSKVNLKEVNVCHLYRIVTKTVQYVSTILLP